MFQMFRYQPTEKSTSSARDCHDLPREEARLEASVSSEAAHDSDATRGESEMPSSDAAFEHRLTSAMGTDDSAVAERRPVMRKEAHPDWGCQRISDMPGSRARAARHAG